MKNPTARFAFARAAGLAGIAAAIIAPWCAPAATRTWDGGSAADSNWSSGGAGGNWGGAAAPVANDVVTFGGSVRLTPHNDIAGGTAFRGITFASGAGAFTLGGNAVVLGGGITNASASLQTLNMALALQTNVVLSTAAGGGDVAIGGVVSGGAAFALVKQAAGTLTLSAANSYAGATDVRRGTLVLSGASGAIASSSGVTLYTNGVLTISNTAAANNADRIGNGAGVTAYGGGLSFTHSAGAADYGETLGALAVNAGALTLGTSQAAGGQTSALTLSSVSRAAGGTVLFAGTGFGVDTRNQVLVTTALNGQNVNGILPWAAINDGGAYSLAVGGAGGAAITKYAAHDTTGASPAWGATVNARPGSAILLTGAKSLNSLVLDAGIDFSATTADRTITFGGSGLALTVQTGGASTIMRSAANNYEYLWSCAAGTERVFIIMGTLTLERGNANTWTWAAGAGNSATKSGPGTLNLGSTAGLGGFAASNFGGTFAINQGTVRLTGQNTTTTGLGTGVLAMNGGKLSIAESAARTYTPSVVVNADSIMESDRWNSAANGYSYVLGALTVNNAPTLTLVQGANVASGTTSGFTFGNTTLNSPVTFRLTKQNTGMLLTVGAVTNNGFTVTLQGNGDFAQGAPISGAGGLTLDAAFTGTATLSRTNAYSGATVINGGKVTLSSNGSITNSASVRVGSGAMFNASGAAAPHTVCDGKSLGGAGVVNGNVVVASGGVLAPGGVGTPGTLVLTNGLLTCSGGSRITWELDAVTATGENQDSYRGTHFDFLNFTNSSALLVPPVAAAVNLDVTGLGTVANWNPATNYQWTIACAPAIGGFAASKFAINVSGLATSGGTFSLASSTPSALVLTFTPSSTPAPTPAVAIDLSSALNYDGVGTPGERDFASPYYRTTDVWTGVTRGAAVSSMIKDAMIGTWPATVSDNHNLDQWGTHTFVDQALAAKASGAGWIGMPEDYLVGEFELGKGASVPPGYNRYGRPTWSFTSWPDVTNTYPYIVNNAIRIDRASATVTLVPAQQQRYASFNILFCSYRASAAATYTARVEAKYAGEAWTTAWEDSEACAANTPGGTFSTAHGDNTLNGTFEGADDIDPNTFGNAPYTTVRVVTGAKNTRYIGNSGSPANIALNTSNRYLWTWDSNAAVPGNQGVPLDSSKVLEGLRFTTAGGTSHRLYLFAISAVPILNEAPVIQESDPQAVTMDEDGAPAAWVAPTLTAADANGDAVTWTKLSGPSHGTADVSGTGTDPVDFTVFTYAPSNGWNGADSFVVQASDGLLSDTITVNVTVNARNDPPVNTVAASVSGLHQTGQTLTATPGTWDDGADTNVTGTSVLTLTHQWQRADDGAGANAEDIGGATDTTYVLTGAELGKFVRLREVCTDSGVGLPASQSVTIDTAWTAVSGANAAPVIDQDDPVDVVIDEDGAPAGWVAPTLTASDADGDELTWTKLSGPWHGTATVSGTGTDPVTFTAFTYAPSNHWHGADSFVVQVSDGFLTDTITVNVAVTPRNDPPNNTVLPSVSGTHRVGQTVTADGGTWDDGLDPNPGNLTLTRQWRRANDAAGTGAVDIPGETGATYALTYDDGAKYIGVRVTCTDDGEGLPATQSAAADSAWAYVQHQYVPLDMSAAFNYDAIATVGERSYCNPYYRYTNVWTGVVLDNATNASSIYHAMMGTWPATVAHNHNCGQYEGGEAIIEQALADLATGTSKIGLPANYLVGDFELGKGVTPPAGYSRYGRPAWSFTSWPDVTNTYPRVMNNAVRLSRSSADIMLSAAERGKYRAFNLLFTEWRSTAAATFTARVEAKYAGEAWVTVWEDVAVISAANTAGGSFATAAADGALNGSWADADGVDPNTFGDAPYAVVTPVSAYMTTHYLGSTGSPFVYNTFYTANRHLWTWDSDATAPGNQGVDLDDTKVLEGLRVTATTDSTYRGHRMYVFAINAVAAPNAAPQIEQAGPLAVGMDEDGSPAGWIAPAVTATDADAADTLTWSLLSGPAHGTAEVSGTGAAPAVFTYAPDDDWHGVDSFDLQVSDGAATDTITVNVTVAARNDPPAKTADVTVSGLHQTGQTLTVTPGAWTDTTDTDAGGSSTLDLAYKWQRANDAGGTGAADIPGETGATYVLAGADLNKYVRVQETCTDSGVGTPAAQSVASASPWVLVTRPNTAPVVQQAGPLAVTMDEDGSPTAWVAPTLTAIDGEDDTLTWSLLSGPAHGTAVVSGTGADPVTFTAFTYDPSTNWSGTDSFVVQVSDGVATDTITVNVSVTPRNDPPNNTVAPATVGTHQVGRTVTASDGTWNDTTDLTPGTLVFSRQWRRATDAAGTGAQDIAGATGAAYALTLTDAAKYVSIRVTCADDGEGLPAPLSTTVDSAWAYVRETGESLDMGAAFNFDAIGSVGEYEYCSPYYRNTDVWTGLARGAAVASTLWDTMNGTWGVSTSHNVAQYENNGRCYIGQSLADLATGSNKVGLPQDYIIGDFELGKGIAPAAGYDRYGRASWSLTGWPDVTNTYPHLVNNALRIYRSSSEMTLPPSQRGFYNSFNILFSVWRSASAATYTARIEARYAGGTWETVWEDVDACIANTAGGSFATGGGDNTMNGTWEDTDGVDPNAFGNAPYVSVTPVVAHTSTRYQTNSGGPASSSLSTANRHLWTWDSDAGTPGSQGIPIDSARVLEGLRFTATSSGSAYGHRLYLFAVSLNGRQPAKGSLFKFR